MGLTGRLCAGLAHITTTFPPQISENALGEAFETKIFFLEGYRKVATLMGTYSEFAILRSFHTLNMQNLLYLQAEITHLEAKMHHQAAEDIAIGKSPDHVHD
jgi:hypothetical protein